MKRFILNCLAFVPLLIILLHVRPLILIYTEKYKDTVAGSEIYHSIFKSKQKKKTRKILLGDSVGNQLFSNKTNNDTINSLACNRAIGLVGQFLLLNNCFNAGNKIDTVYLFYLPFSFSNNLDQIYTYQYFLKPFYHYEYYKMFTQTVKQQVHKIPYWILCQYPYFLTSNWSPDFVTKDKLDYTFLSPISVEYLAKMKELCSMHNCKLIIISPPVRNSKKSFLDNLDTSRIGKNNLSDVFRNYFENIIYLDDTNFIDQVHLKNPKNYIEYFKNQFIKNQKNL